MATSVMVVALLGITEPAAEAKPIYLPKPQQEKPLPRQVERLTSPHVPIPHTQPRGVRATMPTPSTTAAVVSARRVGTTGSGTSAVTASVLSAGVSKRLGIDGVIVKVSAPATNPVNLTMSYTDYANAYGGHWAHRLQLVQLPACALTTPELPACQTQTPLETVLHYKAQTVTGSLEPATSTLSRAAGGATDAVVALTAAPSGPSGDFTSTSLQPAGSWSVGGATGGFNWDYPITVPPAGTGADVAPKISLSYNSQEVDGQNSSSNTQPSWVGEGWSYDPGYIERTYRTCSEDTSLDQADKTPDVCWAGQIVTMHLPGGPTTALVKKYSDGEWKMQSDAGARIELKTGADNGAHDGEYWVVTTTDGTRFTFGRDMLPGAAAGQGTNSAFTEPVFGPKAGDTCHDLPGKHCQMAYRWNVDLIEDVHHNAAVYTYTQEKNYYQSQGAGGSRLQYTRGGYLDNIRYGLTSTNGGLFDTAPQQVSFHTSERCWPYTDPLEHTVYGCSDSDFNNTPAAWFDTPADLACDATGACDNTSPTFFTRRRLDTITTSFWDGTSRQTVDVYDLSQSFHNVGDNEMVLDGIDHTGHDGGTTLSTPPISFAYDQRDNHVVDVNAMPSMLHQRMTGITGETGQIIEIHYADELGQEGRAKPMCTKATIPASPASNTTECFPVKWTPLGHTDPIVDYFHKYVVTEVDVEDKNGTSYNRPTTYTYIGTPAWHYDDNEVLKPKMRTWGQFRGYGEVDVRTGDPTVNVIGPSFGGTVDKQTLEKTFYLRGMDGDKTATGTRTAKVNATDGTVITDAPEFNGQVYETQQYNGSGGTLLSKTISTPKTWATTGSRAREGLDPLQATIVRPNLSVTYTAKAAGGWLKATTTSTFDTMGRPTKVLTAGDSAVGNCVNTTYADNTTLWVMDKASEVKTFTGTCPTDNTPPVKDIRTYYDGFSTLGSVGIGDATKTETAKTATEWITARTTYDDYGRVLTTTQVNPGASAGDRVTRTAYTPAGVGALTKVTTTQPVTTLVDTRWVDPGRGTVTKATTADGLLTQASYDPLGRLTAVWRPGQVQGTDPATETYSYLINPDKPLAVTTKTLIDPGQGAATSYRTRIQIYDAFGNPRQAQAQGVGGTVAVTDTFADTHGWGVMSYDHWYTLGAPTTDLLTGVGPTSVDGWRTTTFDGAGRPTATSARKGASTITGTTTTVYGGDRVTVLPPTGGIAFTTITNGLGQKSEYDQYTTTPTRTGDVITGGSPQVVKYTYDALEQLTEQTTAYGTALAATWKNTYDLAGRVTTSISPDSGTTRTTYLDTGEVDTTTDANANKLAFDYDAIGRPTGKYVGSLTGQKLATWTYDTLLKGHPTSSSATVDGATYTQTVTGYDNAGRPLGTTVGLSEAGFNTSYTTTQSWTSTGLMATMQLAGSTDASGAGLSPETLTYGYDALGNARTMVGLNNYVSASTTNAYDEPTQLVLGVNSQTGSLNFTRDVENRRITDMTLTGQSAIPQLEKMAYTYDQNGNVTKMVDTQGGPTAPAETNCYAYDQLRQLTEAWSSTDACATRPSALGNTTKVGGPQPYAMSWTYDAGGNRNKQIIRKTGAMTADETTTYTIGGTGYTVHQVAKAETKLGTSTTAATTRAFTYDPVGNIKTRNITGATTDSTSIAYRSDGTVGTLINTAGTSRYIRDADGNILMRADTTGSTSTTTLYLPGQEVAIAKNGTTITGVTVTRYYSFDGINIAMRTNKGNVRYVMGDLHGTNQVAVNPLDWTAIRRTYDPFGNQIGANTPSGSTFPGTHTFLNQPYNSVAKYIDLGARLYDPILGRFAAVDPQISTDDPQQANGYSYAENNPVSFSDPTGLMYQTVGGGGSRGDSTSSTATSTYDGLDCQAYCAMPTVPPSPPSATEQFLHGFARGAGDQGAAMLSALNPKNIVANLKSLASSAVHNPWGFLKTVVTGITHFDEIKAAWNSCTSGTMDQCGEAVGKLVVSVGGDVAASIVGVGASKLIGAAVRKTSALDSTALVESKVVEMQNSMTPMEARLTTYAAAHVTKADGDMEMWVAGAGKEGYVRPAIRGDAINVKAPAPSALSSLPHINDAEMHIYRTAQAEGATINAIGATRPVCTWCQAALPAYVPIVTARK